MWVLAISLRYSGRTVGALNYQVVSPAPLLRYFNVNLKTSMKEV